jgi:hypothetical protein
MSSGATPEYTVLTATNGTVMSGEASFGREIRIETSHHDQHEQSQHADRVVDGEVRQPERLVPTEVFLERILPLEKTVRRTPLGEVLLVAVSAVSAAIAPQQSSEPAHLPPPALTSLTRSPASTN